jgi:peptide/nickel transport system permease protein
VNKAWRIALTLVAGSVGLGILGALPPEPPMPGISLVPPTAEYWLGTDLLGRDVAYRSLIAIGYTLSESVFILLGSVIIGTVLATVSAFRYERELDRMIVLCAEGLRAFPTLLMALLFATAGAPASLLLILYFWIPVWRIFRAAVVPQQRQPYVLSARLLGFSRWQVLIREVLPNVFPQTVPYLAAVLAEILSVQAALEFLGFGPPLEQPSLGGLLLESIQLGFVGPWVWLPSLIVILMLVWGITSLTRRYQRQQQWVPIR